MSLKPHYTAEQKARYNATQKRKNQANTAAGLCYVCGLRPIQTEALWDKKVIKTCSWCRERRVNTTGGYRPAPEWCGECLAAGFHRDDCPKMDITLSVSTRIERVLQGLQPRRLRPPSHSISETSADRKSVADASGVKPPTPDTVEDGRSGDEALPESGWGETDFPGLGPQTYTTQGPGKGKTEPVIQGG